MNESDSSTVKKGVKRYCMSHRKEVDEDKGSVVIRSGQRRWLCFECQAKSTICPRTQKSVKKKEN